jgi:hypothetical protein
MVRDGLGEHDGRGDEVARFGGPPRGGAVLQKRVSPRKP